MIAILFILGSALLGVSLARQTARGLLSGVEQILWGTVVGWIATAFVVYLLARWQGQLSARMVLCVTLAIWVVAAILLVIELRRERWSLHSMLDFDRRYLGLAFVLLVLAPIYWRLLSVQMFPAWRRWPLFGQRRE